MILIVDDSSTVRDALSTVLTAAGYKTLTAVDGKDGLIKSANPEIKLIFCDVNMPNMDGLTMCEQVRKGTNKFVKVIILTTENNESMKTRGKAAGVSGWIVKPFSPDVIVKAAKQLIG